MSLGILIKNRRKELGITQKELAVGICAQALISKIENDEVEPSKRKLKMIAEKLNLELDLYYTEQGPNNIVIERLKTAIREFLKNRDYKSVQELVSINSAKINRLSSSNDKAFFEWICALLMYHSEHKPIEALEKLNSIKLSEIDTELIAEILNEKGKVYYLEENYNEAITVYEKALKLEVPFDLKAKLIFNYALVLESKKEYRNTINLLVRGIDLLVKNRSLYLLGDYFYQKGYVYRKMEDFEEAKSNYQKALTIFEIENNRFSELAKMELKEIEEILNT